MRPPLSGRLQPQGVGRRGASRDKTFEPLSRRDLGVQWVRAPPDPRGRRGQERPGDGPRTRNGAAPEVRVLGETLRPSGRAVRRKIRVQVSVCPFRTPIRLARRPDPGPLTGALPPLTGRVGGSTDGPGRGVVDHLIDHTSSGGMERDRQSDLESVKVPLEP